MKVIVATTTTPFVYGGATLIVNWLEEALASRGHEVETYRIPVPTTPAELPGQLVGLRHWDFSGHGDRLISVRTPSYLVRHHSKVAWFLHHHRPAYDLWDAYPDVADSPDGWEFRRMMFSSDEVGLLECERVFTNSIRVQERLNHYNGIDSEVLYPALGENVILDHGPVGDSLVYVSRFAPHKRQLLAVQAIAQCKTPVKLTVAGGTPDPRYVAQIQAEIARLGIGDRVTFIPEVVTDDQKRDFLRQSLGVVYVPLDEDSYGFVGLEAAAAGKPLVTTSDSGGVLELVDDGVNGYVCRPSASELAKAFDALYSDRERARRMGEALTAKVSQLNISWDHIVDRLLA
jgi:glycosyltransferase involved in cell wall biosynthesis